VAGVGMGQLHGGRYWLLGGVLRAGHAAAAVDLQDESMGGRAGEGAAEGVRKRRCQDGDLLLSLHVFDHKYKAPTHSIWPCLILQVLPQPPSQWSS
jgi:hypothetical protein